MSMEGHVDHPYVPRDLKLPGYVPVFLSQSTILAVYGASSVLVVSVMWLLSGDPSTTFTLLKIKLIYELFYTIVSFVSRFAA